jgi:hypothetical protein
MAELLVSQLEHAPLPLEATLVDALDRAASCSNNAAARNNAVALPHSYSWRWHSSSYNPLNLSRAVHGHAMDEQEAPQYEGSPELFMFLASTVHDMKNSISVLSGTLENLLAPPIRAPAPRIQPDGAHAVPDQAPQR